MIKSVSKSSLTMFLRCPAQFERRYINGEIIPPGITGIRGRATHKAIEVNNKQKLKTRKDLPVSDLQDAARDCYIDTIKTEGVFIPKSLIPDKNTLLNEGLNASISLAKLYRDEIAPLTQPALVEEKLEIDAGLIWPISGIIDCYTEDKKLPDYKSADKSPAKGIADNSLELTFYAGLTAHHTGEWPIEVSLDYLVNLKGGAKYDSQKSKRGPDDWANLMLRVQLMIQQIETGLFPPCNPENYLCTPKWCGYYNSCKYSIKRR